MDLSRHKLNPEATWFSTEERLYTTIFSRLTLLSHPEDPIVNDRQQLDVVHLRPHRSCDDLRQFDLRERLLMVALFPFSISAASHRSHHPCMIWVNHGL